MESRGGVPALCAPGGALMRGLFIVLEGIDGAGKSEQRRRLAARMREITAGRQGVVECADSRFGSWGAAARAWAQGAESLRDVIDPEFALGCFVLDRHHLSRFVADTLRTPEGVGQHVVCDRWEPSTWAYQLATGMSAGQVARWLHLFPPAAKPDLTLWLRCHPLYALERVDRAAVARLRPSMRQRYETPHFLALVDEHYATLPGLVPVDAEDEPELVTERLLQHVVGLLLRRGLAGPLT
jgi:thymidylate kinase